jgi:drug/metabolite transporter (DMT)-like permease
MLWFIVIILAYLLFAVTNLVNKFILAGPPNPKGYSFYVGILSILTIFLIPFVGFSIPSFYQILLCLLSGAVFIFAILGLFEGLEKFETSRVIPAIGAISPLFIFALIFLFSGGKEILSIKEMLAFILLIVGGVFITYNPSAKVSLRSLKLSAITSFLFAFSFVLAKYVYIMLPFWTGFIWIRIGTFLAAIFFIFFKEVRQELFGKKVTFDKKTGIIFVFNQAIGAIASILQNWAIALAGLIYLSIINALQGVQYVFLFILMMLISVKFPKRFKEDFSKKIILQKIGAILIIGAGLSILALK